MRTTGILLILVLFKLLSASSLMAREEIVFYDSFGYYQKGKLRLTVHGQVFEKEANSAWRNLLVTALKKFIAAKDSNDIFSERIRPFLFDNKRNRIINVLINGENYSLNFTTPDGHTITEIVQDSSRYPINKPSVLTFNCLPNSNNGNIYSGKIRIIPTKGISVISDVDDTIKESKVADKKELLKNAFEKEFLPVTGMPDLLNMLKNKGANFHYLTASPWQLYQPLTEFINKYYPAGVKYMKKFRIKESSIVDFIFQNQTDYKMSAISDLLQRFPRQSFILIGDTGEKDHEIYAQVAAQYPSRIVSVYLRMTDKSKTEESIRNFYANVKGVQLFLFTDPKELQIRN